MINDVVVGNSVSAFTFILLYITVVITPKITRKDVPFGVLIPLDRVKDEEITRITREYYIKVSVATIVVGIGYLILMNIFANTPMNLVVAIFLNMALYFMTFLNANKKVKAYKKKENLMKNKKQLVYVDTNIAQRLRKNSTISNWWFLIPGIIAILNLVIPLIKYDSLPNEIATHWNISGVADKFVEKSTQSVVANGMMILFLVLIMVFVNYSIAMSKNKIDVNQPISSGRKLLKFKKINSIMIYGMALLISSLITLFNFNSLDIISIDIAKWTPLLTLIFVIITVIPIVLNIKIGQGGSNLKSDEEEEINNEVSNIDDDYFWKLGSIYYNPNDPALFVEKRFGVGWTLNFANKKSVIILVVFIIFILMINVLLIK